MRRAAMEAKKPGPRGSDSGFACMECGHRFKTVKAAARAADKGCPKCGGVDVDLAGSGS
jgi:Zn finger protein HypA/HybF involved in hydrogenase expression